jgi:hypothetical protein
MDHTDTKIFLVKARVGDIHQPPISVIAESDIAARNSVIETFYDDAVDFMGIGETSLDNAAALGRTQDDYGVMIHDATWEDVAGILDVGAIEELSGWRQKQE